MDTNKEVISDLKGKLAQYLGLPETERVSLPPVVYGSEDVTELEIEVIFRKEWICLGRTDEVAQAGDYFTTDLVGEPLIIVRDKSGEVNVLSNVCRHRWAAVAEGKGKGNAKAFVCPYHAWTYRHNGELMAAAFMDETEGFEKKDCSLPKVRSELWNGFIFATLDPDLTSVRERLSELEPIVANYGLGEMKKFTGDDETWQTNWKLLVENFTEAYHTFQAHKESLQKAVPSALTMFQDDQNDHFSAFYSPFSPSEPAREPCHSDLTPEERSRVAMVSLFPSLVIALAPDRVFYMCLTPKSAGEVNVRWGVSSYGEEFEHSAIKDVARFYGVVNKEDKDRLETIQIGIRSNFATQSRLSWLETTNMHFGHYIAKKLVSAM